MHRVRTFFSCEFSKVGIKYIYVIKHSTGYESLYKSKIKDDSSYVIKGKDRQINHFVLILIELFDTAIIKINPVAIFGGKRYHSTIPQILILIIDLNSYMGL